MTAITLENLKKQFEVDELIGFGDKSCDWEYCIWASGLGFEEFFNKWVWGVE